MALFSLLPILGFGLFLFSRFNRNISSSIFFSITFIITTLYIFGLLNILLIGSYTLFYAGTGLLGYLLYTRKQDVVIALKSPPLGIFLVSSVIYLYLFQDAQYAFWDEYSHWGVYIKEMMFTHRLHDSGSISAHLRYPPGAAIWQYFIALNTGYSEASTFFAIFILLMGSTLMLYEQLSYKEVHWIASVLLAQAVVFADFGHGFNSIYVDHVIGAIFTGIILSFLSQKNNPKSIWLFTFPLASIVLMKDIGLYFGVAAVGLFILLSFAQTKDATVSFRDRIKKNKKIYLVLMGLILINIVVHFSWSLRQDILGVVKNKAYKTSVSDIVKSISTDEQRLSSENEVLFQERFWKVFFDQQIHKSKVSQNYHEFSYNIMDKFTSPVKFTTFTILLFTLFMLSVLSFAYKAKELKLQVAIIGLYITCITVFYIFIIRYSYPVALGNDALRIPSYVRYANIGIMPLMFVTLSLCLPMFHKSALERKIDSTYRNYIIFFTFLGFIVIIYGVTNPYLNTLYTPKNTSFRGKLDTTVKSIQEKLSKNSKLFIVYPIKETGYDRYVLKFLFIPIKSTVSENNFLDQADELILKTYTQYDYVWFPIINDLVFLKNRHILKLNNQKNFFGLYKISADATQFHFDPVY